MKASDFIAEYLHAQGVGQVFEVAGGVIAHLLDSMDRLGRPRLVSVHHEQAAAFAADAVGRLTGVPGVAMASSGPGAINLLTGVGGAHFDSSPAVFLTGQVNRSEQKGSRAVRQLGFQETDIAAMAGPVTKAALRLRAAGDLPDMLDEAFHLALSGRPGPVLLDLPMDLQRADIARKPRKLPRPAPAPARVPPLDGLLAALKKARRPLVLIGGGIRSARAADAFRGLAGALGVPVVHSLMALDVLPDGHPLRVGLIGSYGNRWSNLAIGRCDLLVVLGSRLDVRQTGSDTASFQRGRVIIHVDCEAGEMNNRLSGCRTLRAHLLPFFAALRRRLGARRRPFVERPEWLRELASLKAAWPDTAELAGVEGINPNVLMRELSSRSGRAAGYLCDVGQHQMWAAQSLRLRAGQSFLTSGGMGAMGFALPAAIGAAFSDPGRPFVVVAGDGGFQLNIQELQTVARNRLPLKMVLLNNRCHGMVRQFQESYFGTRYTSTVRGYSAPDFVAVARAYGVAAAAVRGERGLEAGLEALWRDPREPFLLEVPIATAANAYPKIAFGSPMTEMEPQVKPAKMGEGRAGRAPRGAPRRAGKRS